MPGASRAPDGHGFLGGLVLCVGSCFRSKIPGASPHRDKKAVIAQAFRKAAVTDSMNSVFLNGLSGLRMGMESAARDSERVVRAFTTNPEEDPVEPLLNLQRDARQVQASAAVIRVADELTRYTLDIIA